MPVFFLLAELIYLSYDALMQSFNKTYEVEAPPEEVWKALVDSEYIEKWGGGPAIMDEHIGTKFELWGGDIHGTNVEVIEKKKLVQEWYGGDWAEASRVTFLMKPKERITEIELQHDNIPDKEYTSICKGWDDFYLGPISEFLEY